MSESNVTVTNTPPLVCAVCEQDVRAAAIIEELGDTVTVCSDCLSGLAERVRRAEG